MANRNISLVVLDDLPLDVEHGPVGAVLLLVEARDGFVGQPVAHHFGGQVGLAGVRWQFGQNGVLGREGLRGEVLLDGVQVGLQVLFAGEQPRFAFGRGDELGGFDGVG